MYVLHISLNVITSPASWLWMAEEIYSLRSQVMPVIMRSDFYKLPAAAFFLALTAANLLASSWARHYRQIINEFNMYFVQLIHATWNLEAETTAPHYNGRNHRRSDPS
jgi:hypothetical protein